MQHVILREAHYIVSSLAIFFVDHVADYVALNSESESRRVAIGIGVTGYGDALKQKGGS